VRTLSCFVFVACPCLQALDHCTSGENIRGDYLRPKMGMVFACLGEHILLELALVLLLPLVLLLLLCTSLASQKQCSKNLNPVPEFLLQLCFHLKARMECSLHGLYMEGSTGLLQIFCLVRPDLVSLLHRFYLFKNLTWMFCRLD